MRLPRGTSSVFWENNGSTAAILHKRDEKSASSSNRTHSNDHMGTSSHRLGFYNLENTVAYFKLCSLLLGDNFKVITWSIQKDCYTFDKRTHNMLSSLYMKGLKPSMSLWHCGRESSTCCNFRKHMQIEKAPANQENIIISLTVASNAHNTTKWRILFAALFFVWYVLWVFAVHFFICLCCEHFQRVCCKIY